MIFAVAKMGKEQGYKWSTNLDALKSFVEMVDSGFERKPGRFGEIYSTFREDHKEAVADKSSR